jgi:hemerythrin superfamily protein
VADIVEVIKAQHRQVDQLLEQAQQEGADTRSLLQQVSELLLPHSEAEESFVYPTIREHDRSQADEVHDGTAEHHHIEELLQELLSQQPGSPGYDGKLTAMVAELRHHVEEEEQDLLPVLSEHASAEERAELAARFIEATGQDGGAAAGVPQASGGAKTRDELYEKAKEQDVPGRSSMTKEELAEAVDDE